MLNFGERKIEQVAPAPISTREMTFKDGLTDVGWLTGNTKTEMMDHYLDTHGQYFDRGVRVTK